MTTLATIRRHAMRSLIPPPRIALSQWIEQNIKLPEGVSALPGAIRQTIEEGVEEDRGGEAREVGSRHRR
jgi:hypothetical protein